MDSDYELVITPKELQPIFDILTRIAVALERVAYEQEQQTAISKQNTAAMDGMSSMFKGLGG